MNRTNKVLSFLMASLLLASCADSEAMYPAILNKKNITRVAVLGAVGLTSYALLRDPIKNYFSYATSSVTDIVKEHPGKTALTVGLLGLGGYYCYSKLLRGKNNVRPIQPIPDPIYIEEEQGERTSALERLRVLNEYYSQEGILQIISNPWAVAFLRSALPIIIDRIEEKHGSAEALYNWLTKPISAPWLGESGLRNLTSANRGYSNYHFELSENRNTILIYYMREQCTRDPQNKYNYITQRVKVDVDEGTFVKDLLKKIEEFSSRHTNPRLPQAEFAHNHNRNYKQD